MTLDAHSRSFARVSVSSVFGFLTFIALSFAAPFQDSVRASQAAIDGTQLFPLSTSSRWIVDSTGKRVKLRCVNWAGHMEANVPEGLQYRTPDQIATYIANYGFNCVRLTYSIDMALAQTYSIKQSFSNAGITTGTNMNSVFSQATSINSWMSSGTLIDAYAKVVTSLNSKGIRVILDNHVSREQWCCNIGDGNGWWASASGYNDANSHWFDTQKWLNGLKAMATWSKSYPNIVGMSLRNELRATGNQDKDDHNDYYNLTSLGAQSIHAGNSDLLIMFGGVNYATDLSFIGSRPLDKSTWGGASKTVYEAHLYSWSASNLDNCDTLSSYAGNQWGYLLAQGKSYTGPLWVSEFGVGLNGGSNYGVADSDYGYLKCLVQYLESNDADWSYWALQGSYYVRDNATNSDESFGILDKTWQNTRDTQFAGLLGTMWNVTQGP